MNFKGLTAGDILSVEDLFTFITMTDGTSAIAVRTFGKCNSVSMVSTLIPFTMSGDISTIGICCDF